MEIKNPISIQKSLKETFKNVHYIPTEKVLFVLLYHKWLRCYKERLEIGNNKYSDDALLAIAVAAYRIDTEVFPKTKEMTPQEYIDGIRKDFPEVQDSLIISVYNDVKADGILFKELYDGVRHYRDMNYTDVCKIFCTIVWSFIAI